MHNRLGQIQTGTMLQNVFNEYLKYATEERFGKWLYNNYVFDDRRWHSLYDEVDDNKAFGIALQHILGSTSHDEPCSELDVYAFDS
jgi:hypothetical protein